MKSKKIDKEIVIEKEITKETVEEEYGKLDVRNYVSKEAYEIYSDIWKKKETAEINAWIGEQVTPDGSFYLLQEVVYAACYEYALKHRDATNKLTHAGVETLDVTGNAYVICNRYLKDVHEGNKTIAKKPKHYLMTIIRNSLQTTCRVEGQLFAPLQKANSAKRNLIRKATSEEGMDPEEYEKLSEADKQKYDLARNQTNPLHLDQSQQNGDLRTPLTDLIPDPNSEGGFRCTESNATVDRFMSCLPSGLGEVIFRVMYENELMERDQRLNRHDRTEQAVIHMQTRYNIPEEYTQQVIKDLFRYIDNNAPELRRCLAA